MLLTMTDANEIDRLEALIALARAAGETAAAALGGATIQRGRTALFGGVQTVPAIITSTSRILVSFNTSNGGGGSTVKLEVPDANRIPGPAGSFFIRALTAADVLNALDSSLVDWTVIN